MPPEVSDHTLQHDVPHGSAGRPIHSLWITPRIGPAAGPATADYSAEYEERTLTASESHTPPGTAPRTEPGTAPPAEPGTAPRTALVTGANRGLGRAVAARLHELGHRVVIAARDEDAALATAADLGGTATGIALDVTDAASVERARAAAGPVDIVVNNAAILLDRGQPVTSVEPDLVAEHVVVNAVGALRVSQAFLPGMLERGWGRIVMLSSENGLISGLQAQAPAYSASKAALNAIIVLLARATQGTGVLVNAVSPGRVRTRLLPEAERTPQEAAVAVADVALLPDDAPTGAFFRDGRVVPW
jgi:NAD(P)-dependent dehydrogenase (short-subunit alcohol dehydrogenase family)